MPRTPKRRETVNLMSQRKSQLKITKVKDKFKTNNDNPEWNHDIKFDVDDETPEEVTLEVLMKILVKMMLLVRQQYV